MKKNQIPTSLLAALLLHGALPQAAHAASGTWTQTTSGGLWSDTANWLSGIPANGATFNANFNTLDITADDTVRLDSARSLTSLTFGDTNTATAASWILDNNGNAANILTVTNAPIITVNALGTGATATISAEIAGLPGGGPGMIKNGAGTLVLSGANTFTRTSGNGAPAMSINAGKVIIASDSAFGAFTAGFAGNGLLSLNGPTATLEASGTARTVANPIWLNNSPTVEGSLSITFSGTVSGRGGSRTLTNNITSPATLSLTNNVYTDWSGGFSTITFAGTGNTLITSVIANNTANIAGQNGAIAKSGAGTLTLSNTASTYTGATTINGGVMEAAALANGGTASSIGQSTNAATNLVFGAPTATLRYNGSSDATIDRGFTLSSGTGGGATVESSGSGTLTIDNTVALAYGTTGQTRLLTLGGTNTGANTFSKVIANNGSGATSLTKAGTGTWSLTGTNTYTGNTTVSAGTLALGSAGTLKFVPTDNGVCNKITGAGTATLNGTFDIDLTNAAIANGNSWTLVDTTTKNGTLSAVTGFSGSSGVWSKVDGNNTWTFTESTGLLSLAVVTISPAITLTGTLSAVDTTYGTASTTPTSFTLAGSNLTGAPGNLTVTPPAGYEVSSGAGYNTSLSVPYTSGTLSSTTISVRLAATAAVNGGAGYTGDITVDGGGASSQTIATVSSTVAPVSLTLTANDQNKFFGDTQTTPVTGSTAFTSSGLVNEETIGTVTLDYSAGALDAGDLPGATSTITPSAAAGGTFDPSNYNAIVYNTGTLTVLAAPTITLGGTLGSVDTTYGSPTAAPTSFTVSSSDLLPASGNLTVTPPAGYEVSSDAGYTTSLSVPYTGGTLSSTTVSVRLAATTAVNGGAGYSGDITVAGGGTSQTIATVSSTVAQANLAITADNQSKAYNTTQTSPVTDSAAFTNSALQNGETVSTVTLTYGAGALDATDAVASTSTITPSTAAGTLNADNYNITYNPGTLTVVKATPTATLAVNNSPVTYNGSAQAATVGITVSSVTGTVQNILTGGAADQTNAGSYSVTADFVPDDTTNYDTLTGVSAGNFVIDKADATVVVTPYTVTYDGNPQTATVTSITGVNGETDATVGTVTLDTTHTNAGVYTSDTWIFTGTANYNNIGSAPSSIAVANGSFETTGQALGGPWFTFGSPWSITNSPSNYQVINAVTGGAFSSTVAGGGTYIGLINQDDCPITAPLVQNLGTSVTNGDTLSVTFYIGRALTGAAGAGVAYFDVDGTKYTMAFDTSAMVAGTWQLQTMTKTITNSGNLTLGFYGTTGNQINAWLDLVSDVSRAPTGIQTLTNTINKATPTATLAVNNSPVTYDGTPQSATVNVTTSSVPGSAQNILTGGAATQTAAGNYAVTADFVPTDTTNYNTLTAQNAGQFAIVSTNTYSAWATTNGITGGVNGDSNNDGVQNGIAYFMNATGQATLPGIIGNTVTWTNGGNIESSAYGTQFVVETSPDLATWTPVAVSDPNLSNTEGSVSYTLSSGLDKQFVRLVVTPD